MLIMRNENERRARMTPEQRRLEDSINYDQMLEWLTLHPQATEAPKDFRGSREEFVERSLELADRLGRDPQEDVNSQRERLGLEPAEIAPDLKGGILPRT